MGNERIYDGKGRKVVTEGIGSQKNTYQHFKGFSEEHALDFDREWNKAAERMGFRAFANALPFEPSYSPQVYDEYGSYG